MPIQAPQWTDYLNCPVCCREFGAPPRSPVSLGCGHTICKHCLRHLHRRQCPFDQTVIQVEPEDLAVNTALLQLAGYAPPSQPYHPPCIQGLPETDRQAYDVIVHCMEHLAVYLKFCSNAANNNNISGGRLSRPMQRKLIILVQCAITDEEGRGRAARAARSLGERTVLELIVQQQNPQQLSANLWAAVRARGCQFLGPAMQEEVLKLVLLALEDGSALSRKVLVMFVVQRLEPDFPQASKTSIGHVVQLLYRASCFRVSKRECDSSLMQLKEEFRTYESLRREHDAQIVQIATEAGLRIAPDQWSALLYGDTAHKSHMQSIIDKLQTPQSFAQSVEELIYLLHRTGNPTKLRMLNMHLVKLANIDSSPDARNPTWQELADIMISLKEVVSSLIHYLQHQVTGRDSNYNQRHSLQDRSMEPSTSQTSPQTAGSTPTHTKAAARSFCPCGNACNFAHSEDELERTIAINNNPSNANGNFLYNMDSTQPTLQLSHNVQVPTNVPPPIIYQGYSSSTMPAANAQPPNNMYGTAHMPALTVPVLPEAPRHMQEMQPNNYPNYALMQNNQINLNQNGMPFVPYTEQSYASRYAGMLPLHEEPNTPPPHYPPPDYTVFPVMQTFEQESSLVPLTHNVYPGQSEEIQVNFYRFDDTPQSDVVPEFHPPQNAGLLPVTRNGVPAGTWSANTNMYNVMPDRRVIGTNRPLVTSGRMAPSTSNADPNRDHVFHFETLRNAMPNSDNVFNFEPMRNALPSIENPMFNVPNDGRVMGVGQPLAAAENIAVNSPPAEPNRDDHELEEELLALERRIDTEFKSD